MKLSQREIAEKVGKSEAAVSKIVKRRGIPKEGGKIDFEKYGDIFSALPVQYSHEGGGGGAERERLALGNAYLKTQIENKVLDRSKKELEIEELKKSLLEKEAMGRLVSKMVLMSNQGRREMLSKALELSLVMEERKRHYEMEVAFQKSNETFLKAVAELGREIGLSIDIRRFLVRDPIEWMEENVVLVNSEKSGNYRFEDVHYFREIVRDFFRPEVRELHVKSSAQVGKTQLIVGLIAYLIYNDPSPMLFITANDDLVEDFSKMKFMKTMKASNLAGALSEESNTIHLKAFPGGSLFLASSVNEKSMISRSLKYIFCDEVSRWENANAFNLLRSRVKTFPLAKLMTFGNPSVKGSCLTSSLYDMGDGNRYHVQCPRCSRWVEFVFKHLKYKGEERIHYQCQKCKGRIYEEEKKALLGRGKFLPTHEGVSKGIKSYHLSEMVSLLSKWENVVEEWKRSKSDVAGLRTFINMTLGEEWEGEDGKVSLRSNESVKEYLAGRLAYRREVPLDVVVLTMGVDVQANRLEGEVVGYGVEKVYGIKKFVIHGEADNPSTWEELSVIMKRSYEHEKGELMKVGVVFIDSGYRAKMVYDFVDKVRGEGVNAYAIKGHVKTSYPIIDHEKAKSQMPILIGVHQAKDVIYSELSGYLKSLKGEGKYEGKKYFFPIAKEYEREYFLGLFSERKMRVVDKSNKASYKYVKKGHRYNEALDCRVYALAGYYFLNVDLKAYLEQGKLYNSVERGTRVVEFTSHFKSDLEV